MASSAWRGKCDAVLHSRWQRIEVHRRTAVLVPDGAHHCGYVRRIVHFLAVGVEHANPSGLSLCRERADHTDTLGGSAEATQLGVHRECTVGLSNV